VIRVVADLGNTRLKWGLVSPAGAVEAQPALPVDETETWAPAFAAAGLDRAPSRWAVATVNPAAADRLAAILAPWPAESRRFSLAADISQPHRLDHPERTGVDRALGVFAARALVPAGAALQVVSCGSAVTVDAVDAAGVWRGGAIAPGLPLLSRSLHAMTAQLPLVGVDEAVPPAVGASTVPAIRAGLVWGLVGLVREILARQAAELGGASPRVLWTGGDAARVAPWVAGPAAQVVPDLVLRGLAASAFGP
jgi:type III pantothenate kinase